MSEQIVDDNSELFMQLSDTKEMIKVITRKEAMKMGKTRGQVQDYTKRGVIRTIKRFGSVYIDLYSFVKVLNNEKLKILNTENE